MMGKDGNVTFESLSLQELKKADTQHIDASGVVATCPLYLLDWEITAKANGTGVLIFRDGQAATSRVRMEIQVTKSSTLCQSYNWPRFFNQGLYLSFGGDVEHICIHYLLIPKM